MNENKKITKISDEEIRQGIEKGIFKEDGTQIRDTANGQIVKVLKQQDPGLNHIPSTFIQVHNSYVYQADLSPIIEAIAHSRECGVYDELEEQYNLAMDYLDAYVTYETGIEKVYQICLEIAVSFDNKIRREIESIEVKDIENINKERFLGSLNAYVKILFSYIVSTFLLHNDKFYKDKIIISKILNFERYVRTLYEQLLAESHVEQKWDGSKTTIIPMSYSLYSMYLFHEDYDLLELENFVKHDSRFSTPLDVINFFKTHFKSGRIPNHKDLYNSDSVEISVSTVNINKNSNRCTIAKALYQILEDIEKLKGVREEIVTLKDVSGTDILRMFS
ncbi:hypothetical protein RA806_003508 [Vibrio cholerae]|nr:hypothetical protein [Vibrio cholerae]